MNSIWQNNSNSEPSKNLMNPSAPKDNNSENLMNPSAPKQKNNSRSIMNPGATGLDDIKDLRNKITQIQNNIDNMGEKEIKKKQQQVLQSYFNIITKDHVELAEAVQDLTEKAI